MTHEYKIGDRVRYVGPNGDGMLSVGSLGTIHGSANTPMSINVEWDDLTTGHQGTGGKGKPGSCWVVNLSELQPLSSSSLKIGDKVRITEASKGSLDYRFVGHVGTIRAFSEGDYNDVYLDISDKSWPEGFPTKIKYLELVAEPKKARFKFNGFSHDQIISNEAANWPDQIYRLEGFSRFTTDNFSPPTTIKPDKPMKGTPTMSSSTNLINAKLSADERYARTNGLKNADGTVTTEGMRVMNQWLWDTNEKAIVKDLKAADKAIRAAAAADAADLAVDPQ